MPLPPLMMMMVLKLLPFPLLQPKPFSAGSFTGTRSWKVGRAAYCAFPLPSLLPYHSIGPSPSLPFYRLWAMGVIPEVEIFSTPMWAFFI